MSISARYASVTGLMLGIALVLSGCVPVLVRNDRTVPGRRGGPAVFKIPPGHYPPPGECRLWVPGRPPGHQPPPKPCGRIRAPVPPSTRLIRRPARPADQVEVSFYHDSKKNRVIVVGRYRIPGGERITGRSEENERDPADRRGR